MSNSASGLVAFLTKKAIDRVAHVGAKIALSMVGVTAFGMTLPITPLFLWFAGDDCKAKSLLEQSDKTKECVETAAARLDYLYRKEINLAVQSPNQFMEQIASHKNGLGARLACSVIENVLDSWEGLMKNTSCQGRTLQVGDTRYLIHKEGYLYRHVGQAYTLNFGKSGRSLEVEKQDPRTNHKITQNEKLEADAIVALSPRIQEVIKTCSVQPQQPLQFEPEESTP